MELTAVFESWHIGDGNYPPLHVGQRANLSFEIDAKHLEEASLDLPENFIHLGSAEYRFCGKILRVYEHEGNEKIVVIKAKDFCFYIERRKSDHHQAGMKITGEGTLLLDHYIWVEFLDTYADPPNLFYNLKVTRIRKIRIPDQLVVRSGTSISYPCRLAPKEYSESDIEELSTMQGQNFNEEFYLVDFDSKGLEKEEIARTFI